MNPLRLSAGYQKSCGFHDRPPLTFNGTSAGLPGRWREPQVLLTESQTVRERRT
jgi:hypothetical protein